MQNKTLHNKFTILPFICLTLALVATNAVYADTNLTDWPFCHPAQRNYPNYLQPDSTLDNETQVTHLHADKLAGHLDEQYTLHGNVVIWRGNQWMEADEAIYDITTEQAELSGDIRLGNLNLSAHGIHGKFDLAKNQGSIENATYYLFEQHGRGTADLITFESPTFTRLKKAAYTTCDEEHNDWYIHARYVSLNKETGIGTAAPVYITFYNVPILFSPYLSFPIDDRRKSGFLFPSFGRSSESGSEIAVPYYLNLAPNYDATITPIYMSRRGILLDNEFRYLTEKSDGYIQASYLANDEVYNDDRSLYAITHRGRPAQNWYTLLDAKYVSDQDYLEDFDNNLNSATTTHLEEKAEVAYTNERTHAKLLLQGYQTLDKTIPEAQRPYRRLPQITFNHWDTSWQDQLQTEIDGEYVYFDRTDRLIAHRLDLTPSISLPFERQAGFITPKLSLRHTQYELDDTEPNQQKSFNRTLSKASIDMGIFLEREFKLFDKEYVQTLEPRAYYRYTPYKDQRQLPSFDTGLNTFGYSYLFLEERFSGADRVGDAQQVSIALTSRLLDGEKGIERLRGSIGQIFYIKDRRVGLSGNTQETASQSDIVAEGSARLGQYWSSRAELIWNHQNDEIDKGSFSLTYDAGTKRYISSSYFWTRSGLSEQTNIAISWPLSARWHFVGRHLFAHRQTRTMEAIAGLEYTSCCWGISLLHRRHQYAESDEHNESLMLQLHLKGLASIGNPIENIINENILGQPSD